VKAFCLANIFVVVTAAFCVTPSELVWRHHFAEDKKHPEISYSLLSLGFFTAELSDDFESRVKRWLAEHPRAVLRPILTREPLNERVPNSKLIVIWIVDGGENLNVYLVRHGCVGAHLMLAMTDDDSDVQRALGLPKDKLEVPIDDYRAVRKQLIEAEEKAKQERLGIWAKPATNEERTED
jgi:hypothetical protein